MKMKKQRTVCIALLLAFAAALSAQQKYALVIGNGAYQNISRLNNPVNDAGDIQAALEGLGFQVDLLTNANLSKMEDAAIQLKNKLRNTPDSCGFFFYAGHGVQSQGQNYLIPVDADIKSESFLKERAFNVQILYDELEQAGNALNIIVLDACRNNPFGWSRSGTRGLTVVSEQPAGSIIVYATGAGQTAADGAGRNGLFTGQLLKNLPLDVEVKDLFNRTGLDVLKASNGEQRPAVYNTFFGQAFLPPNHRENSVIVDPVVVPPQPRPVPPVSDAKFVGTWNAVVTYKDGNQNYRDSYKIELFDDSTCNISVSAKENGKELWQDADGTWSYDDTFFRLECDFLHPVIFRLPSLRWTSVYTLDTNNRRLVLLVYPAPGVRNTVKVTITKARQ
jgi:hypothetical protein